jgi:predicted secreted protein
VSYTTVLAIYFIIWWLVLFAVLPWGIRSQHEGDEPIASGTDPGAPIIARIGRKLIWTTVLSAILFAVFYIGYVNRWVTIDQLANWLGFP